MFSPGTILIGIGDERFANTIESIDFVIPDGSVEAVKEVMTTGHFSEQISICPDTKKCVEGSSPDRLHPHPSFHMHVPIRGLSVGIYVQSETLWFLPPLDATLASPKANPLPPYLTFACDPTALPPDNAGMGRGAFSLDQTVVLVPKVHILTEALMRIMARDDATKVGSYSGAHLCYIVRYVEKRGILDIGLLPEGLGNVYREFRDGPASVPLVVIKLKRLLGVSLPLRFYD